jgi:acid phosphatase type 7
MRTLFLLPVAFVPALAFAACSDSAPATPPTDDASTGTSLTYTPSGCAYSVTQPEVRGSLDQALDAEDKLADVATAAPQRVRLGLGGGTDSSKPGYADPSTTAVFTWETDDAAAKAAQVRFGTSPTALSEVRKGYSWTTPPPTAGLGNNEPPVRMHEVHVCGLEAGKTYYYQVGGGPAGGDAWSATQSFVTVPKSGAPGAITIGVSGDSRDSADIFQLVQTRMKDAGASLQLFTGDFVIFGTQSSTYKQWLDKSWKDPADATKFLTLGQQMFLTVAGNHEAEAAQYFSNFALPGDGPRAEQFGSFNAGNAHIILLDDTPLADAPDGDAAKDQLAWLEGDLTRAEADRAAHPFIIATHHRGEFTTGRHAGERDVVRVRDALVPLWDKHHVDLVVVGHDHNYERSKSITGPGNAPVVKSSTKDGTTYVIAAGAGASAYAPGTDAAPFREKNAGFGSGTSFVGVYVLLTLDANKVAMKAYGLKSAGGSVAGDDLIDELELTR